MQSCRGEEMLIYKAGSQYGFSKEGHPLFSNHGRSEIGIGMEGESNIRSGWLYSTTRSTANSFILTHYIMIEYCLQ
jgi:hypothetical protein